MNPGHPSGGAAPGAVLVAGMHRSGTSFTAGLLAGMGIDFGSRLVPADAANPRGYFEDADVVAFHQRMFAALVPPAPGGHADWGWTPAGVMAAAGGGGWTEEARRLVAARNAAGRIWGFKDPRATLLLDFWDPLLPRPSYVAVYRRPELVADSIQRLGADVFLRYPGLAWTFWRLYNERLLAFVRARRDRCLLINSEALPGSLDRFHGLLESRLGVRARAAGSPMHFEPDLMATGERSGCGERLARVAWPECAALYAALEGEADVPLGPRRAAAPATPAATPTADPGWADLSIAVCTYNDAEMLVEALTSVERCVGQGAEVLICDDGTTDPASLRVLERLEADGWRILRQRNAGLPAARNRLIRMARGKFILPLDADNRLVPGFLERALPALREDPGLGVVHGDLHLFGLKRGRVLVPAFDLGRMLHGNTIDACALFRREAWAQVGGYDENFLCLEDWEFWLNLGKRGWRFRHLPLVALEYRVRPGSLLARGDTAAGRRRFRLLLRRKHPDLLAALLPVRVRRWARLGPAPAPGVVPKIGWWEALVARLYWRRHWRREPGAARAREH